MNIIFVDLLCIVAFIIAIRRMASPKTAVSGCHIAFAGMILAIFAAFQFSEIKPLYLLVALTAGAIVGIISGLKIKITALPQMIAIFNGLGGGAAACIAAEEIDGIREISFALPIGAITGILTFSGSIIAFCKLQGILSGHPRPIRFSVIINILFAALVIGLGICYIATADIKVFFIMSAFALIWGCFFIWPIGGADMPIIISILNSFSGWASVAIGFAQQNILMIAVGTIVSASGGILAYIMTKAMNTSVFKLFLSQKSAIKNTSQSQTQCVHTGSAQDAIFIMQNAQKIIIVPGFGMAAASAQHALKTMGDLLHNKYGVNVKYAIHPVAGRMPGHMNVLLAEAGVDYRQVFELGDINREFATADVAYVIGANDITNPEAKNNPDSPLFGMPILDVGAAKTVIFVKRSLANGYAGIDNPLFFAPNTIMLYGDAKKVTEEIDKALEQ